MFSKKEIAVLEEARTILASKFNTNPVFSSSADVRLYLQAALAPREQEVFAVMFLNNRSQLIRYVEMFFGTIDAASVYPREVAKLALELNAAAVIFAHNHPSGIAEPSIADQKITSRLAECLAYFDIRVLDHLIVGHGSVTSFAERGLL